MEPHRNIVTLVEFRPNIADGPAAYFEQASVFVRKYYAEELARISSVKFYEVTPEFFFQEYVWVVHATGFSAKTVGNFMPRLMNAYGGWAKYSTRKFDEAFEEIRKICNNPQKAKAVHTTATLMHEARVDWDVYWTAYRQEKLSTPILLKELPYVGKVTCFHLARNIGLLEFVKPDLHLIRLANHWGFPDCTTMCEAVRPAGMPLGIVDLILWYACSTFGTLEIRKDGGR